MNRNSTMKAFCLSLFTLCLSFLTTTNLNAQCELSCIGQLNTSLDTAGCAAVITVDMALNAVDDPTTCPDLEIQITGFANDSIFAVGNFEYKVVNTVTGNECWGNVRVEDKTAPFITCPIDVTISCADDSSPEAIAIRIAEMMDDDSQLAGTLGLPNNGAENALAWGVDVVECSDFNLQFRDELIDGGCDGDTIRRTFTATDAYNRISTCTQEIYLEPQDLTDITLPDNYDCLEDDEADCADRVEPYGTVERVFPLNCDGAGTDWAILENGNPSPDDKMTEDGGIIPGTGRIGGINCGTIQAGYNDTRIAICTEPGMECAQNSPSFKVVREWKILDWCTGIIIEHNQIIKVLDTVPPVITALDDVTIGTSLWDCSATYVLPLGEASDNCSVDIRREYSSTAGSIANGVLTIPDNAKTMDDTLMVMVDYYDCCGNITSDTFSVFVIDNVPPTPIADLHTVVSLSTFEDDGLSKVFATSIDDGSLDNCGPVGIGIRRLSGTCTGFTEEDDAGKYFDFVHVCCKDVGNIVMVEFRVCDDADMDGIFASAGDNCNLAMVEVEVQDKLPPACFAPADVTIDCIDFAALGDIDRVNAGTMDDVFGEADGAGTCRVRITQELTSQEDCGLGELIRTITVTNTNNDLESECEQRIMVVADPDINFLVCSDISFPDNSAEQIAFVNAGITTVWCETNPLNVGDPLDSDDGIDLPAIEVMECTGVNITSPEIDLDNLCSEVGIKLTLDTFDFAGGGCKKILAHWEIIDQCKFDENYLHDVDGIAGNGDEEINPFVAENGYFELYIEYDLFDTEGPVIVCGEGFNAECDGTLTGVLTATATDDCTENANFFGWTWQFDLGGDGSVDFEGEGNEITPENLGMTSFPDGQHIVTWIVSDGCGNLSSMDCPLGFEIVDTKAPTPYCYDGLSTAVMLENGVTLWAEDFNAGSFDNCGEVFVTIVPESDVAGLTEAEAYSESLNLVTNVTTGKEEYGWNFTCAYITNGVSETIDVRLYATDEAGNFDYCTASLRLQDNLGACQDVDGLIATIGGNIATSEDQMVSEVEVEAMASNPEFPKYTTTDEAGNYAFYSNQMGLDYEITSAKNDDYRNGVSTLDLVLIQKHILGIATLTNPYQLIAADVNNDSSVKASDLLQLRKLILGLYENDNLPNNESWRFVASEFTFEDGSQPWPFDEVSNIEDLTVDAMSENFIAVKTGDINGTVVTSTDKGSSVRSSKQMNLEVVNQEYAAGEEVVVNFTSSDFHEVHGYQFTLDFGKGLSFVSFESGSLNLSEGNFGLNRLSEGILSTSYDNVRGISTLEDEVLFSITFVAVESGKVGDNMKITSQITESESYVGTNLEIQEVGLRTKEGTVAAGFALYQNEPNPFKGSTMISFNMAESGSASLKVYDVTGKVLYSENGSYTKGKNQINVAKLAATGVMYYQLNAGEYTATKKMIVIE